MSRPCDPSGRVSALPLAVSAADFACFRLRRRQRGLRRAPTLANSILMVAAAAAVAQAATCPFNGGWSLRVDAAACPPSAPIACGAGIQPRCCPSGLQCAGDGDYVGNYCCPPGSATAPRLSTRPGPAVVGHLLTAVFSRQVSTAAPTHRELPRYATYSTLHRARAMAPSPNPASSRARC